MLSGDNGILKQAKKAKENTEVAQKEEEIKIELQGYLVEFEANKSKLSQLERNEDGVIRITEPEGIRNYIPSYDENKYKLEIRYTEDFGYYVLSVSDNTMQIMTKEKIEACEKIGFYLSGDIEKDGIINEKDRDKMNELMEGKCLVNLEMYEKFKEKGYTKRDIIVADISGDGCINSAEKLIMSTIISSLNTEERGIVTNIRNEYRNMLRESGKKEDGTYKEINATTEEEIQKYIPSYKESLNLVYKLIIQRGELYWVYDKTNGYVPDYTGGIKILGDITGDHEVDENDIEDFEYLIRESEYEEIADLNNDGVIDNKDLEILKAMI